MTRTTVALALATTGLWAVTLPAQTPAPQANAPARYGIGRPATPAEVAARDIDIPPDGRGLPPGRGTPSEGAAVYATKCAKCHGATGKEGPNDVLVGREPRDFSFSTDVKAPRTIGNYWPYATTVFDYVRRARRAWLADRRRGLRRECAPAASERAHPGQCGDGCGIPPEGVDAGQGPLQAARTLRPAATGRESCDHGDTSNGWSPCRKLIVIALP